MIPLVVVGPREISLDIEPPPLIGVAKHRSPSTASMPTIVISGI